MHVERGADRFGGFVVEVPHQGHDGRGADPGILRTAAQHNHANVGVYAGVVEGGAIRRGDLVRIE